MVKILGALDIFAALALLSICYNVEVPRGIVIAIAALLCLKGSIFIFDIASILDIAAGILIFLSLFMVLPHLVLLIFAAAVGLKGIESLFTFS